jgi:HAD superfamily hydrolase (TIGR01450 family)
VRHPVTGLLRITADTSFSNVSSIKLFNKADNRGHVISVVHIHGDKVRIYGELFDGAHDTTLHVDQREDQMPHCLVGRQLKSEAWVKAVMVKESMSDDQDRFKESNEDFLCVVRGRGFHVNKSIETTTQCCFTLKEEYKVAGSAMDKVPYHKLRGSMLAMDAQMSVEASAVDPDQNDFYATASTMTSMAFEKQSVLDRRGTFSFKEFVGYTTYIFAPQGTIYNLHDPEKKLSSEELGDEIIRKVNDLISSRRVLFMSNNSRESRLGIASKLKKRGVALDGDGVSQIISAGYTCAWFLKQAAIKKPFVLCSHTGLLEELQLMGIKDYVATINDDGTAKQEYLERLDDSSTIMRLVNKHPDIDCVVAGWDQQLTTLKIAVAAMYFRLNPDLKLVACSMDHSGVLGTHGDTQVHAVGNGVIANAVCNALGKESTFAIDVGKPSFIMLDQIKKSKQEGGFEVDLPRAVMVGDTLATDMELARRGGMKSCLVFSGVTSQEEYDQLSSAKRPPVTWTCPTFASM